MQGVVVAVRSLGSHVVVLGGLVFAGRPVKDNLVTGLTLLVKLHIAGVLVNPEPIFLVRIVVSPESYPEEVSTEKLEVDLDNLPKPEDIVLSQKVFKIKFPFYVLWNVKNHIVPKKPVKFGAEGKYVRIIMISIQMNMTAE